MPSRVTTKGVRNRDLSTVGTLAARYISFYLTTTNATAPAPANKIFRFSDDEALVVLGFRASVNNAAAGITTLTVNLSNASGSMLSSGAMSIKGYNQQVRSAVISTTNNVMAANEVGFVDITNSNNENVYDLSVVIKVRPYIGAEAVPVGL